MEIVLLHNYFSPEGLVEIMEQMKLLGPPTIRAYDLEFDDLYQAIEGSHRLRACEHLGIEPVIEEVAPDALIEDLDLDVDFVEGDTVSTLGDWENYKIDLDDIGANLRDDDDDDDD